MCFYFKYLKQTPVNTKTVYTIYTKTLYKCYAIVTGTNLMFSVYEKGEVTLEG